MEEQLRVRFIGDDNSLSKASKDAEKSLSGVEKASKSLTTALRTQAQVSQQAVVGANQMAKGAAVAGGAAAKSTKDYTNLGRVLQDLPFGFTGIQNNLTQLIPAAGAAGLAFSGLISALTFAQVGFGAWTRGLGGSKEALEDQVKAANDAKRALENYVETLNDIDKATVKGLQNAQEELVSLKTLYDATQNVNIPLAQRKKLVDELQDQYPKYFANISDEIILAGGAKTAYEQLANAIIATAKAKAFSDEITELQKQINASDRLLAEKRTEFLKQQALSGSNAAGQVKQATQLTAKNLESQIDQITTSISKGRNKAKSAWDNFISSVTDNSGLKQRLQNVQKELNTFVETNPDALTDPTGTVNLPKVDKQKAKKDDDDLKKLLEEKKKILTEFQKDFETIKLPLPNLSKTLEAFDVTELKRELSNKLANALTGITDNLEVKGIDPKNVPIPLKPTIVWQPTEFQKQLENFNKQLTELVANTQFNFAVGLGEGIASAINGNGLEDAFKNIAVIMGDFLQSLGKLLIKESIQIQLFKKAFAALLANPIAGLAVGVGLVALGGIIKNTVMPKPKGFAEGGLVFGPTLGLVGEGIGTNRNNPEIIAPLDKLKKFINPNSGATIVGGELRLRGPDLVAALAINQKSQKGNFGR